MFPPPLGRLLFTLVLSTTSVLAFPRPSSSSSISPHPINASTNPLNASTHSLIQTRLYHPPSLLAASSLTGRTSATFSRPINTCASRIALFISSHCLHNEGTVGSMQSYLTYCREAGQLDGPRDRNPGGGPPTRPVRVPRPTAEPGSCGEREICVNGRIPGGWGGRMARCVGKEWFVEMIGRGRDDGGVEVKEGGGVELEGMMASLVVSDGEGRTPVRVGRLEVDSGGFDDELSSPSSSSISSSSSSSAASSSSPLVKTQMCKDCFELTTPDFAQKTGFLKTETTVLETGVVAGILWLAVLSG